MEVIKLLSSQHVFPASLTLLSYGSVHTATYELQNLLKTENLHNIIIEQLLEELQ